MGVEQLPVVVSKVNAGCKTTPQQATRLESVPDPRPER